MVSLIGILINKDMVKKQKQKPNKTKIRWRVKFSMRMGVAMGSTGLTRSLGGLELIILKV